MANILFIEDEDFIITPFANTLVDNDHNVTLAKDGEEAIRYLKNRDCHFNLIILDIMLPQGEVEGSPLISESISDYERGAEILRILREEMKNETPVIVLTAVGDEEFKRRVLGMGVERYFTKPVSLGTFMNEVNNVLSRKASS